MRRRTLLSRPDTVILSRTDTNFQDDKEESQVNPLREDRNKNITAYPAEWSGGFGRDFYVHEKRRERMAEIVGSAGSISVKGKPFKEPELQVSEKEKVGQAIEELITEMKGRHE